MKAALSGKRPLLLPMLALASAWAFAQGSWFVLASDDPDRNQPMVEVNLDTVRLRATQGEGVIRVTYDVLHAHTGGYGYRSAVAGVQVDCATRSVSYGVATYYVLPRGEGQRMGSDSYLRDNGMPGLLETVSPAARQALLKAICAGASN